MDIMKYLNASTNETCAISLLLNNMVRALPKVIAFRDQKEQLGVFIGCLSLGVSSFIVYFLVIVITLFS